MKYTKESDIFAFGILWAELVKAVNQQPQKSWSYSQQEKIILDNPPSSNFLETKLFGAGLGNKPDLPDVLQDTARSIVNKYVTRCHVLKSMINLDAVIAHQKLDRQRHHFRIY